MPGLPVLKVGSGCLLYGLLLRAYSLPGYRCLLYPGMASCYTYTVHTLCDMIEDLKAERFFWAT